MDSKHNESMNCSANVIDLIILYLDQKIYIIKKKLAGEAISKSCKKEC